MMQSLPTDYNGIKPKIINRKVSSISPNVQQPNNTTSQLSKARIKKKRNLREFQNVLKHTKKPSFS